MKRLSIKNTFAVLSMIIIVGCDDTVQQPALSLEPVRYEVECDYCWVRSYQYFDNRGWSHVNDIEFDNKFEIHFLAPKDQEVAGFTVNATRFVVDSLETFYRPGNFIDSVYVQDTIINGQDTSYITIDTLYLNSVNRHEKIQEVVGLIWINDSLYLRDTLTGETLNFTLK